MRHLAAVTLLDLEDIDAAIAELDARYLTGEAAAHARTWSVLLGAYAAINRRELPATTPDFEDKDHRRGAAFASGDMTEYLRVGWDLDQDIQFLHRGRTSAERPRNSRHSRRTWGLT